MMEGGLDALIEAGCALLGGHSIEEAEPKLGYAVTGFVDPERAWRNNSLQSGLVLILTKPIGTGLVNMAVRANCASEEAVKASQTSMARLNKKAAELLSSFDVRACTDVTGFGLAGHAAEMAAGKSCGLRLFAREIPLLPGANTPPWASCPRGHGGTRRAGFGPYREPPISRRSCWTCFSILRPRAVFSQPSRPSPRKRRWAHCARPESMRESWGRAGDRRGKWTSSFEKGDTQ
jgi:hypothetical protein